MSWSKFHFNCRFLSQKLSEEISFANAKELLFKSYSKNNIGGKLEVDSLESKLFNSISAEPDAKKLQSILSIYGGLNFAWDLTTLTKLKNIRNYLFALFSVFLLLSFIYKFYVLPEFFNIFVEMEHPISEELGRFNTIWLISITVMLPISFILLRFYSFVDQIGIKEINFNSTFFTRVFIPVKIKNKLKLIDALTNAPIEKVVNDFSSEQIEIFRNFKSDNLQISEELQVLLNTYRASLLKLINAHIIKLLSLFSLAIMSAVGYLVWSFYKPIFSLGMIV